MQERKRKGEKRNLNFGKLTGCGDRYRAVISTVHGQILKTGRKSPKKILLLKKCKFNFKVLPFHHLKKYSLVTFLEQNQ